MSASLTSGQMHRALVATGELAELRSINEFPERACEVLRAVIACDHCGYNSIDLDLGRAIVVANPREKVFDGGPEILARQGRQNPIIVRGLAGDTSVQLLSDHMTRRQLHATQLYTDVYRRISLEYQMGVRLPNFGRGPGLSGHVVALSLARQRRDFTEADRLMLGLLRPHFVAALERLHQLALTDAVVAGLRAGGGWRVLLVDAEDIVAWASDDCAESLGVRPGQRLRLDPQVPIRRLPDAYPELDAVLVMPPQPGPPDVSHLGLTPRRAEVLKLAIGGLSAQEIADTLVLSRRTVENHLMAIYDHLGVRTRAQAIAVATGAAQKAANGYAPRPAPRPPGRSEG